MWILRDLQRTWGTNASLPVRVLRGLRQCGKSSLLEHLAPTRRVVSLDDVVARDVAQRDPALFLSTHPPPLTIDEAQYAPALFSELKRAVDDARRQRRHETQRDETGTSEPRLDIAWLTGSNQFAPRRGANRTNIHRPEADEILLDRASAESLAGRASLDTLHTCSVHELTSAGVVPATAPLDVLLRGGWPELYADRALDAARFLDDFVLTYIEKDVVVAGGITQRGAFLRVLRLLAARTAQVQNHADIAQNVGVQVSTVSGWVDVLERMLVVRRLPPWFSNLEKRLTKTPKVYVLDTGLAARLQGWRSVEPLIDSPQAGPLFETLVFGEIVRAIDHARLPLAVHLWRTKEGEEVDFLVTRTDRGPDAPGAALALDAKLAIQGVSPVSVPPRLARAMPETKTMHLVTLGGERRRLSSTCEQVPVAGLFDLLATFAGQG